MKIKRASLIRILAIVLVLAIVLPFAACRKHPDINTDPITDPSVAPKQTYTVQVESASGLPLENVGVYIYEDETMAELVWFDQTGSDGTMTFTDVPRNSYVAVLADVPTGYVAEDMYPITGETTTIILAQGQLDEDNIQDLIYKPGDQVMDFTVTDAAGNSYTLSELLQQKKAVVLNFWYIECAPCNMEFPFLQEAYEQNKDDIALLALNPLNAADAIAAFQAEKGYTFSMMACENSWEKLFGISAYPTTIVIDRFGNIALKHTGTIDNAKTFNDAFAFFAAEDYTAQVVDDIHALETLAEEGTAENPTQIGGQTSFQITVDPGKEVYTELYKAKNMYMSIRGENKDFYVLYNNKTYRPDSSGTVGFVITTGDNYTPALFAVGNESDKQQTYQVSLGHLSGSFNNPYKLPMGDFTAKVSAGNEQGVYYKSTAPEDGTFIVQCISAPAGVEYDFSLQSLDESKTILRNYQGDGTVDEESGYPTVTLPLSKGTGIMFSVGTLPDDSSSYPGGTFQFRVTFQAGELEEEEEEEMLDYTVTVVDPEGNPVKDVTVWLSLENETFSAVTDEQGLMTLNLVKGTYAGTISIPEGFTLENNAFELTPEAPTATVQLAAVVDTRVEYTITVTDPFDAPVEGAEVLIIGVGSVLTDAAGKAVFTLEPGNYTVMTGAVPAEYVCEVMLNLTAEETAGTLVLEFQPGTENNPIWITEEDSVITNTATTWYATRFNGTTMTITGNAGFTVTLGGTTVTETGGTITLPVETDSPFAPMIFSLTGEGDYRVSFTYPVGHRMNPAQLVLGQNTAQQKAGNSDYHYTWTAMADGKLTITMDKTAQWVYCLNNVTAGTFGETHWSDDETPVISETICVTVGDQITLTVNTYDPADMFQNPAGTVVFHADFTWIVDGVPFTTALTPAGGRYSYEITGASGLVLVISDPDAYVMYGNTTFGADTTGRVIVPLNREIPTLVTIGNCGKTAETYDVTFTYPLGHAQKPDTLVLGKTETPNLTGDQPYHYVWTAIGNGKLTVTMETSSNWTYSLSNLTAGVTGQVCTSGDAAVQKATTLAVQTGDKVLLTVDTENAPGTVAFNAAFTWVIPQIPFTTAQIPAGESFAYEITGASGLILNISDPDAYVIYSGTTFGANSAGQVIVPLTREIPTLVTIGNSGSAAESYAVTFTYPVGHAMNPDRLLLGYTETPNLTGNYPYYYTWTAPGNGYLDFMIALADSWTYQITNLTTGDIYTGSKAENLDRSSVSVAAGDELLLRMDTSGTTGTVAFLTDFTWVVTEIPFTTIQLTAGEAVSYEIHGAEDMVLTIDDADASVHYEGETFLADASGKVNVQLLNMSPALVTIGNTGTQAESYTVTFSYPLGHAQNPDALVLGYTETTRHAIQDPYQYTWTAPGDGKLHFAITQGEKWRYTIHNLTTGQIGTTYSSHDVVPQSETTLSVAAGDELLLLVDASGATGKVGFTTDFTWVIHEIPFETALIPAGETFVYEVSGVAEGLLVMQDSNVSVSYNGTVAVPDSTGKLTLQMETDDTALLSVTNTGAAEKRFHLAFTWPLGHARNPQVIPCNEHTATLSVKAYHENGYHAQMISTIMGTVTLRMPSAPAGVDYSWQVQIKGSDDVYTPAADGTVSVYVYPGEVLQLVLKTQPGTDGTYPEADFSLTCQMMDDNAVQTITFDPNGGTLEGSTTGLTHKGRLEAMPADPVRPDYNFDGWFDAPTGGNPVTIDTIYKVDTTIYAQWTKIEYQVTFNAQGGSLEGSATVTTTDYQLSSLPTPVRNYYTFNGWFDAPTGGNKVDTTKVYTGNTTLYAQWTKIEYQVTFDAQSGSLEGSATVTTTDRQLSSLPTVKRDYHTFNGWFDAPTGGNKVDTTKVYTGNATLYAQWTKIEYQVTFNAQGGSLEGSTTVTTTDRQLSSLPAATWEGYTFNGWFDAPTGGNKVDTAKVYTGNTVLYAQWTLNYVPPQTRPYTVIVVDGSGHPVTSGVTVTWQGDNGITNKTINNASGSVTADLLPGSYNVILTLSGTWAGYRYDPVTVTATQPVATVQIVEPLAADAPVQSSYVGNFAKVNAGATFVQLDSSQSNYAVYEGAAYCFFYFPIKEEGVYTFTTSNGAPISSWGTNTFFMNKQNADENNVVTWEFKKSNLHSTLAVFFAVEVTGAHSNTILKIANTGKAEYTYLDAPYTVFEGTQTPTVNYKDGKAVAIDANIFKLTTGGKTLTYVDMLNDQYVKGEDGYYHLNTEDGPILYVNLGENAPYRSLGTLVGAIGPYGTAFRKIFFDDNGNPVKNPDDTFRKEDYTDAVVAYSLHVDPELGVYPLTDDLIYMIQNGGEYMGWYKPEDDNYLFKENGLTVDLTLAWMFAVCYLK